MEEWLIGQNLAFLDGLLLFMRLAFGICFVIHALGKLGLVGPGNMKGFIGWLESLNVPFPAIQARMAMLSELIGGTLLALGLFARPACIVLLGTMIVAALIGHKGGGYLITNDPPGVEYVLNLMVVLIVLLVLGPGQFSLDAMLF